VPVGKKEITGNGGRIRPADSLPGGLTLMISEADRCDQKECKSLLQVADRAGDSAWLDHASLRTLADY
jgi:hypothetical protein